MDYKILILLSSIFSFISAIPIFNLVSDGVTNSYIILSHVREFNFRFMLGFILAVLMVSNAYVGVFSFEASTTTKWHDDIVKLNDIDNGRLIADIYPGIKNFTKFISKLIIIISIIILEYTALLSFIKKSIVLDYSFLLLVVLLSELIYIALIKSLFISKKLYTNKYLCLAFYVSGLIMSIELLVFNCWLYEQLINFNA